MPDRSWAHDARAQISGVWPVRLVLSVARYRDRHSVAGRKSGHGDAVVLANVLRTDMAMHRPLPADSELTQAIAVLTSSMTSLDSPENTVLTRYIRHI